MTPKVVIDTNVLVGSAYASESSSRRVVEMCLAGELEACVSTAVLREQAFILDRAVSPRHYDESLQRFLQQARRVEPEDTPRVVPEDAEDDKLIAAALAAGASALITNDRHLLELDGHRGLRILQPGAFLREP